MADMYPTMTRQLAFFQKNINDADGLLHPWTTSQWDFLGDWITPHGSESNVTSPENILFNNCYFAYITRLTANIADILGYSTVGSSDWRYHFARHSSHVSTLRL